MAHTPVSRRGALLAALAARSAVAALPSSAPPQVAFGRHKVSRLIVGGNPVSGNSHVSGELDRAMRDYFTAERVKAPLRDCEQAGINTWQSRGDRHIMRLLNEYRLEGGRIQWIGQTASEIADVAANIRDMAAMGAIGVYHHGARTDSAWAAGTIDQVRELLKVARQSGLQVGLGTHIPEVVDYAESKNWDVDFYMTAIYRLSRSREEASKLAGRPVQDELFWDADREPMLERVRRTAKQCLVFKVYGASRKCASRAPMVEALRLVVRYAKPTDAVVIGMYPRATEQVRENCSVLAEVLKLG